MSFPVSEVLQKVYRFPIDKSLIAVSRLPQDITFMCHSFAFYNCLILPVNNSTCKNAQVGPRHVKKGPACNLRITDLSYRFSKNYEDNHNKYSTLRRTGKERWILKKQPEDRFRNLCWSTDCAQTVWSIYAWLAVRDKAQRVYLPWKREQEDRFCFPPFPFLPYFRFQLWGYPNHGRKQIEKKRN